MAETSAQAEEEHRRTYRTGGVNPVRLAQASDEHALYHLLVEMWEYNDRGWGFDFSPLVVIRHIEQGTRQQPLRSDPRDRRLAAIGVIEEDAALVATVGIFLDPPLWFVDPQQCVIPTELWFYVSDRAKGKGYRAALRDWSLDTRDKLRSHVTHRMPLATGFMHQGGRYKAMQWLWQKMWPNAKQVGSLFWID